MEFYAVSRSIKLMLVHFLLVLSILAHVHARLGAKRCYLYECVLEKQLLPTPGGSDGTHPTRSTVLLQIGGSPCCIELLF